MALEIFRLVGKVFVDADAAQKSLQKTDKNAEGLGSKLFEAGKKAGKFALAVGTATVAAGTAIVALTESTREYRTEQGKLQAAFETQNFSAKAARKTYEALNGVLGDSGQAVEAANHLAMLADNEQDLAAWTDICTGVYATFGDSLPIEGLTEAANETAKVGAVTGPLADALNWAGVSEEAFNKSLEKCNSEQERAALITETLNGIYDEAADKYKELNADVIAANKAQDRLNNAMAKIGGAMEPFVTKGKELIAKVLEKAVPIVEKIATETLPKVTKKLEELKDGMTAAKDYVVQAFQPALDGLRDIFNRVKDAVQPYIDKLSEYVKGGQLAEDATNALKDAIDLLADAAEWVVDKITKFTDWCAEHPKTVETITLVLGSFAVAWGLVNTAVGIWSGVATVATAATTALTTAIAILTSPITIAIAIIGAIIAVGVLLWQNWDIIKAKAAELWQALTEKFQQIKDAVINKVTETYNSAVDTFQRLKDSVVNRVSELYAKAKEKFESMKSTISLAVSEAKQSVVDTFQNMYDNAVEKATAIYDAIKEKFEAAKAAIIQPIEDAKAHLQEAVQKIKDFFNFKLKIDISWPEIVVSGGEAPWGIGGQGYPPSIDIIWHKKAMDQAMLLTDPTLFGMQNGRLLGGGEAGNEYVVGETRLLELMSQTVAQQTAAQNDRISALLGAILEAIVDGDSDIVRVLREAKDNGINERDFARLVRKYA